MLVGKRVRQFVDQGGALFQSASGPFQHEQLLLVVVIESGGLFGQKVHCILAQVEIGGYQSQHLEGQLFGAYVGRLQGLLDALFKEQPELVFVEDAVGDRTREAETGNG